ncbi:helix-turn-helix domain-containing protein [Aureimonas fodinaquatilis]|uniref:helix-turn-helix domain-containing protein n=1 Tax=Aureimonas fodinaquatilis TaxID=2565783 RepID=UPI001FEBAEB0|nr:XRE family transcriptional regulator [Aureimonas fodinaquatilis]
MHSQDGRDNVLGHVSSNLRRLRRDAGLSQTALAEAAGVSRRMIVNLEGGDTNVSLSSLDKLASALGVDFVAMVVDPEVNSQRIEAVVWRGNSADSQAVLLGSVPASQEAQLWVWSLAVGERYQAEPDPAGWHEMIAVNSGRLRIEKQDGVVTVEAGDFAIYSSAQTYAYANAGSEIVRFHRVVVR